MHLSKFFPLALILALAIPAYSQCPGGKCPFPGRQQPPSFGGGGGCPGGGCPGGQCPGNSLGRPAPNGQPIWGQQQPAPEYPRGTQPHVQPFTPPDKIPDEVRATHSSVVRIYNGAGGRGKIAGSGTYLGNNKVLTVCHLFKPEGQWIYGNTEVVFPSGESIRAKITSYKEDWDIALLTLDKTPDEATPVSVAAGEVQVGQTLFWIGYAGNNSPDVGTGQVQAIEGTSLVMSTSVRHGDSGGPILNAQGEIVGVVQAKDGNNRITIGANLPSIRSILGKMNLRKKPAPQPAPAPDLPAPCDPVSPVPPGGAPKPPKPDVEINIERNQGKAENAPWRIESSPDQKQEQNPIESHFRNWDHKKVNWWGVAFCLLILANLGYILWRAK